MTSEVRHKRGDVREDGMVFWHYCGGVENWVTPEVHAKRKQAAKDSRDRNIEKARESSRKCYQKHKDKRKTANKAWAKANPEKVAEIQQRHEGSSKRRAYLKEYYQKNKDKYRARSDKWRRDNPERTRALGRKSMGKLRANPVSAYALRVRSLLSCALERKGFWKTGRTEEIVGCSWLDFSAHLESRFLDGMNHDNRHLWHLDHIVPVALARNAQEVNILNHFTNLRPLWGPENLSKGKKLPAEHELPAELNDEVRKIWQRAKDSACTK